MDPPAPKEEEPSTMPPPLPPVASVFVAEPAAAASQQNGTTTSTAPPPALAKISPASPVPPAAVEAAAPLTGSTSSTVPPPPAAATAVSNTSTMPDPPPAEQQQRQQRQNHQEEEATNEDAAAAAASLADSSSPKPAILTATTLGKTYLEIVQEGIADMKDRTGSSLAMIKKWIAANYGSLIESPHFTSRLNKAIRNGVTSRKLLKVRASYKNTESYYKKNNASASSGANGAGAGAGGSNNNNSSNKKKRKSTTGSNGSATVATAAGGATVKQDAASAVKDRKSVDAETAAKKRKAKAAEEERQREKERFELAERLKKRRFPMDDTQLHAEDKELKVKPPAKVKPRPLLPYFWHVPLPLDHPDRRGKTPGMILTYSKADFLDVDSRGLVADLLQVYHFFRGDVHFDFNFDEGRGQSGSGIAPEFTLRHLICAVHQVLNGHAKKNRLVPPLIVHLLVTSLQILLSGIGSYSSPTEAHMYAELHKYMGPALTPVSWSDICHLYMDAMERYYTTEASLQPNVMETEPLTVEYLLGKTDTMETTKMEESRGYLGHTNGSLYKAHHKLAKQDPWTLTAEELMALLRALTEDVLALHPEIMDHRDERLQELVKNKREADTKYRKVRLAYEGPVKKQASNGKEAPFKPTTSRRQFDAAKKAQEQADAEYQKGRHNLIARTVPIGQDRNFNDVYCFRNDPDIMYVEERRPAAITNGSLIPAELQPGRRSWYAIETMSLFDNFVASLDVRGKRENDLYNELVGKPAESPRQYLIDDVSLATKGESRLKEIEALEKRLEEVRLKCLVDDSERRSSRKTLQPEDELREIETELATLRDEVNADATPSVQAYNWDELTGLAALQDFERARKVDKRRKISAVPQGLPILFCSRLDDRRHSDNTGLVGMISSSLLELEEHCNKLVPWSRTDMSRDLWRSRLKDTASAWNFLCSRSVDTPRHTGTRSAPTSPALSMNGDSGRASTRPADVMMKNGHGHCFSPVSNQQAPAIIATLKQLLLDLEERVADITNLAVAARDADLADDNMSTQSDGGKASSESWKRHVHAIQHTPTKRYAKIRELLVLAIADARKAHLPDVVSQLRAALLKYRPIASSSECKEASVLVLENNGGYDPVEDEVAEEKEEPTTLKEDDLPSVVSAEAVTLRSSLDGTEESQREDWVEAVKAAKTLSRFAALCAAFASEAMERVTKLEVEHAALQEALVEWKKPPKEVKVRKRGAPPKEFKDPTEVWADVHIADDLCMVKAADYPWWPAKKCTAKDATMASDLNEVNRSLVAFLGEMGAIRVVPTDNIKPFDGKPVDEEGVEYSKDMMSQLDDCLVMARRITRGMQKQSNGHRDETKTSS